LSASIISLPPRPEPSAAVYVGTAEDVGQAILFLMTNAFMSGAVLDIDGGWR
jgi:NAD(P)-dependent dehydrogenase (short-subunit alcohol dehydrogenase family)